MNIVLGAPSLAGEGANDHKLLEDIDFPCEVKFTNLVARAINFPEISGLHMASCTDYDECSKIAEIKSREALVRLRSSINQIAELNQYKELLSIQYPVEPEPEPEPDVDVDTGSQSSEDEAPVAEPEKKKPAKISRKQTK